MSDYSDASPSSPQVASSVNVRGALAGGIIGAVIGAILLTLVVSSSDFNPWFGSLGVGVITGIGVRFGGRGRDRVLGVIGAALTLLAALGGALGGNYLAARRMLGAAASNLSVTDYLHLILGTARDLDWLLLLLTLLSHNSSPGARERWIEDDRSNR